jgi:hypothetical protein
MSGASTPYSIGELCVGGDWACAHGDLSTLGDIARALAERFADPLHCMLVDLADACRADPERATTAWFGLKPRIWKSLPA